MHDLGFLRRFPRAPGALARIAQRVDDVFRNAGSAKALESPALVFVVFDHVVQHGLDETCDGNTRDGDGCSAACTMEAIDVAGGGFGCSASGAPTTDLMNPRRR